MFSQHLVLELGWNALSSCRRVRLRNDNYISSYPYHSSNILEDQYVKGVAQLVSKLYYIKLSKL